MDTTKSSNRPLDRIINECEQIINNTAATGVDEKAKLLKKIAEIRSQINEQSAGKKNLYHLLFEKAPVGIVQYDEQGILTSCNDQFIEIIGSSREKVIGLDLMTLPDKKAVQAVADSLRGKTGYYEGNYTSKTTEKTTPVRAIFTTTRRVNDAPNGGIGIVEDHTESHLMEIALQESRSRYETLFENNYSVMLIIDPESGSVFDANPAAVDFYGWSRKQLRNSTIYTIDKRGKNAVNKSIENIISANENFFRTVHKRSDGSQKHVEIYGGTIQFANRKLVYFVIHDISKQVETENDLKKIRLGLDRSSNPVLITDENGRIQYINAAFTELYGYTEDEVIGKNPRILKSGDQPESFYTEFWDTILSGRVAAGEIINKTKNGELVTVLYSTNPIIHDDGRVIGFLAIHDDITDRIKMEGDIRQSLYEKDILLAEVHHRVKNNLAMVSALMILQAESAEGEDVKSKLMDSANRIKAISNIHEHLYSTNNFTSVDISENSLQLVHNIIASLPARTEISVGKSSSTVSLAVSQAVYCSLIINEVVTNIIKHAFKDREKGAINIHAEEVGDKVRLTITDDGNKLPDGFSSGNSSSLGMELIHILTRQIEGRFEYLSEENSTSFVLSFKKKTPKKVPIEVLGKVSF